MKIFIIDDEQVSLFLAKTKLKMEDPSLHISTFLSAKDALQTMQLNGENAFPDIILLDLNMPVLDGWEFLNLLVQLPGDDREKCRVYVMTSSVDASDVKKSHEHPRVKDIIHKPLRENELKIVLKKQEPSAEQKGSAS